MEQRMTNQLSGGQQQRVALARALVVEPGVLLFDEPLSNLDAKLRVQMRTEIRRIQQALGITAIYVTHDQSEAMAISDQIILMKNGVIAQMGTPMEIYYRPNSEFVADFIGECNFLHGKVAGKQGRRRIVELPAGKVAVRRRRPAERRRGLRNRAAAGGHHHRGTGHAALPGGAELLHGQLSELSCPGGGGAGEDHRQLPAEQENLPGGRTGHDFL